MMKKRKFSYTVFAAICAAILWAIMFSPVTGPYISFWPLMCASACLLASIAGMSGVKWWKNIRFDWKNIVLGIVAGAALWGIFWIGDRLSSLMFSFARPQVDLIYGIKEGTSPVLIGLLLFFIFGPAEEIFWRGFLQQSISERFSPNAGLIATTLIYALIHASSCNFMLTMAALVAGGFWGLAYRFFPDKLGAIMISHAAWDVAVFIVFPI